MQEAVRAFVLGYRCAFCLFPGSANLSFGGESLCCCWLSHGRRFSELPLVLRRFVWVISSTAEFLTLCLWLATKWFAHTNQNSRARVRL